MHWHQHISSDPFVWNHRSLFFYMRMFLISCVWNNLMKANLYCITISRQIPITRNTSATLKFCFVSKTNGHILLCTGSCDTGRCEHKIHGFKCVPIEDDNNHHYDYTGFLVSLLVVICASTLLVYSIYHCQCNKGKRNTFGLGCHIPLYCFEQTAWNLRNIMVYS